MLLEKEERGNCILGLWILRKPREFDLEGISFGKNVRAVWSCRNEEREGSSERRETCSAFTAYSLLYYVTIFLFFAEIIGICTFFQVCIGRFGYFQVCLRTLVVGRKEEHCVLSIMYWWIRTQESVRIDFERRNMMFRNRTPRRSPSRCDGGQT